MIIYDTKRVPPLIAKYFPDEFVIGKSETGWTSETFYMYIANIFYQWCLQNGIEFLVVLYVDGHSSHLTMALSDFCCQHGIELIALFPNAIHLMQPMDVALFHPLKVAYRNAVRNWRMENNGQCLTKVHFASVLKTALYSLDTKKILVNGFKSCGLLPFSENGINYNKLLKSNKTTVEQENTSGQNTNSVTLQENISFIESNIDSAVLQQFKNHNYCEELLHQSIQNCIIFA